jgi:hypothetical protein
MDLALLEIVASGSTVGAARGLGLMYLPFSWLAISSCEASWLVLLVLLVSKQHFSKVPLAFGPSGRRLYHTAVVGVDHPSVSKGVPWVRYLELLFAVVVTSRVALDGDSQRMVSRLQTSVEGLSRQRITSPHQDDEFQARQSVWDTRTSRKLANYTLVIARIVSSIPSG